MSLSVPTRAGHLSPPRLLPVGVDDFRRLVEGSGDIFWVADTGSDADGGRLLYVSPRVEQLIGLARGRLSDEPQLWNQALLPEDAAKLPSPFFAETGLGQDSECEYRIRDVAGKVHLLHERRIALRRDAGRTVRWAGIAHELPEQPREVDIDAHFVQLIAHELRAPLHAIRGWTYVLRSGGGLRVDQLKALEAIERNTLTQARLVEELEESRLLLCGGMTLEAGPAVLSTLVERAVEAAEPFAGTKHIGVTAVHDTAAEAVWCDEKRLRLGLVNLMVAIVKFTLADGSILLRSGRRSDSLVLELHTSAIAMDPMLLPQLFRDGAPRRDGIPYPVGPGLGLLVAREAVALHGGSLSATSDGSGRGAVFTIELPQGPVDRLS